MAPLTMRRLPRFMRRTLCCNVRARSLSNIKVGFASIGAPV